MLAILLLSALLRRPSTLRTRKNPPAADKCRPKRCGFRHSTAKNQQFQDAVKAKVSKTCPLPKSRRSRQQHEYFDFATMAEAALFGEWDKRTVENGRASRSPSRPCCQRNYLKKLYDHAATRSPSRARKSRETSADCHPSDPELQSSAPVDITYRLQKTQSWLAHL